MTTSQYTITNTNSVPLSFEDELKYARAWRKKKCTTSRDVLIKNYLLFSVKKTGAMYRLLSTDGIMQVAHRALLTSIDKFDADREKVGRLSTILPFYIKVECRKFLREGNVVKVPAKYENEFPQFVSLDKQHVTKHGLKVAGDQYSNGLALYQGDESLDNFEDLIGLSDSAIDDDVREERKHALLESLRELNPSHRKILELVYFKGLNFAQVARRLRPVVTREAVRQKHLKAIQKLRDAIHAKGIFTVK